MGKRRSKRPSQHEVPLPAEPLNLVAGIAPGLELGADHLPAGIASAEETAPATVSVEEIGKMLRCGDATVRRLIRSGALGTVKEQGKVRVRRSDALAYRAGVLPRTPDKPGE